MKHLFLLFFCFAIYAQNKRANNDNLTTEEKLKVLEEEVELLKTDRQLIPSAKEAGKYGFGPAASKVYSVPQTGLSVGGYGEIVYEHFFDKTQSEEESPKTNIWNALRGILYVGYKFNDWLVLNTELEFENAQKAELEFAYVDFMFHEAFNLRGGLLLVPMGLVNEKHEPPVFLGSNRPRVERHIIPSTWRENGVGMFGEFWGLSYRLYVVNSMKNSSFSAFNGLRDGAQKGSKAKADDLAITGRIDYEIQPGFVLGFAGWYGGTGQDAGYNGNTGVFDAHIEYQRYGIWFKALGAGATVSDTLEASNGNMANEIGELMHGFYVELGYDCLNLLNTSHSLIPFVRYEKYNLQAKKREEAVEYPQANRQVITLGLHYRPTFQVVVKTDYEIHTDEAEMGRNQANFVVGYLF